MSSTVPSGSAAGGGGGGGACGASGGYQLNYPVSLQRVPEGIVVRSVITLREKVE